ncbi:TPA: hypothetical protein DCP42_01850 [Patescibacteria group bacterium]|nr:hypothetical protein [Patescibacteria group bacterium]
MQEEATIEKEASAPFLVQIIKENDIQGLVLDLDNTFLMTNEYYWYWQDACSVYIVENFGLNIAQEDFVEKMSYNLHLEYDEKRLLPIQQKYQNALDRYFFENIPENYRSYRKVVKKFFEDFYKGSPEFIEGSDSVLKLMCELEIPFIFNSNAQYDWTRIKVENYEEELNGRKIPFNAVDIDKRKDAKTWSESAQMISVPIGKTLTIGDSLYADILPAIEAGCRNLVWIKGDLDKLPPETRDDPSIHIWCVDSVKDLI